MRLVALCCTLGASIAFCGPKKNRSLVAHAQTHTLASAIDRLVIAESAEEEMIAKERLKEKAFSIERSESGAVNDLLLGYFAEAELIASNPDTKKMRKMKELFALKRDLLLLLEKESHTPAAEAFLEGAHDLFIHVAQLSLSELARMHIRRLLPYAIGTLITAFLLYKISKEVSPALKELTQALASTNKTLSGINEGLDNKWTVLGAITHGPRAYLPEWMGGTPPTPKAEAPKANQQPAAK